MVSSSRNAGRRPVADDVAGGFDRMDAFKEHSSYSSYSSFSSCSTGSRTMALRPGL
jgi:hypothetical protein